MEVSERNPSNLTSQNDEFAEKKVKNAYFTLVNFTKSNWDGFNYIEECLAVVLPPFAAYQGERKHRSCISSPSTAKRFLPQLERSRKSDRSSHGSSEVSR